jgi:hypothetical protein
MGKRVDNDSTMEMSTSQLVPDVPRHDQSVWKQSVVGTEPARRALWVVIAILLLTIAAGAIALLV